MDKTLLALITCWMAIAPLSAEPTVEQCYAQFNSESIPFMAIEQWLSQFDSQDRPDALLLLSHMRYYTYPKMMSDLSLLHQKLLKKLQADGFISSSQDLSFDKVDFSKTYVAKSGDIVSYLYRSSNKIRAVCFKNLGDLYLDPSPKGDKALVILEDYVGSGIQFFIEVYAGQHAELFNQYKKIYFVPLVINSSAIQRISKVQKGDVEALAQDFFTFVNLQDETYKKVVLNEVQQIQPDKLELLYLREETPLNDPKRDPQTAAAIQKLITKYTHRSYFGGNFNAYGHTVFFYNCPNNLPEILWDTRAIKADGSPWTPLFRRVEDLSIYRISSEIPIEDHVW